MKKFTLVLLVLAFAGGAMAQTQASHQVTVALSAFNIIRIHPGDNITLTIDATGLTPGAQPAAVQNSTQYLQYTVIAASNRKITAALNSAMPTGVTLKVVSAIQAGGAGSKGNAQPEITLSASAQDLIKAIGSCWTGTGANQGAQLTYTAESDGSVVAGDVVRTVTYTFAADN